MPFSLTHLSRLLSLSPQPIQRLWVAYSGGMDSHVLLHRLITLRENLPSIVGAIHIHHNLSPQADKWAAHCQMVCAQLGIDCHISHVQVAAGDGLEDSARRARYAALLSHLNAGDAVLSAQHQDDQAETFLLQALRGGGPEGLASMPIIAQLGEGRLVRPLLNVSHQQIYEYAQQWKLCWIEDESNPDTRFDRNYIRHVIMPKLRMRWPAAGKTLARAAAHAAALVQVTETVLQDELKAAAGSRPNTLSITILKSMLSARAALLIRAMCHQLVLPVPATVHIEELLNKQLHASNDRQIYINWRGGEFRRYQDDLFILAPQPPISRMAWQHEWDGKDELHIPELHGVLRLELCLNGGINQKIVRRGLVIKPRHGGERCQPANDTRQRQLKAIFKEHHIPPWERPRLPLIYANDELVAVANVVVCEQAKADYGFRVVWQTI